MQGIKIGRKPTIRLIGRLIELIKIKQKSQKNKLIKIKVKFKDLKNN